MDICPQDICPERYLPRKTFAHKTFAQKDICQEDFCLLLIKQNFMSDKKRTTFFHLFVFLEQKTSGLLLVLPPLQPHSLQTGFFALGGKKQ
jgi:hypothetical protein